MEINGADEFPTIPTPAKGAVPKVDIEAFLQLLHGPPGTGISGATSAARELAIDVRSPGEFEKGHIPGAVNVPLFSNEERAVVGKLYKEQGRYTAIRKGLEFVGPKMAHFLAAMEEHGKEPGSRVLVYCWRGGMRSGSVAWLLSLCDFKVVSLEGGYRSYRRWAQKAVGQEGHTCPAPIVVLGGCTGVGKTAILHQLERRGEQVLDLEGLANHRGSVFGALGQDPQPSSEAYENNIALRMRQVDPARALWVEHEGTHVGNCSVPRAVVGWLKSTPKGALFVLQMDQELRVNRLVEDYCSEENLKADGWVDALRHCISAPKGGLAKRLGGERVKAAMEALDAGQWASVAAMMLDYYDKQYVKWTNDSASPNIIPLHCPTEDAEDNASRVLDVYYGKKSESNGEVDDDAKPAAAELPANGNGKVDDDEDLAEAGAQDARRASANGSGGAGKGAEAEAGAEEQREAPTLRGACFCGEVTISVWGSPRAVSYCHCSICRRLSGAPFSAQALYGAESVKVSFEVGAQLQALQTSRSAERHRCSNCLSPIQATLFGGKVVAIPCGLLGAWRQPTPPAAQPSDQGKESEGGEKEAASPPSMLQPSYHMYYNDRVMDVCDGLPKYAGPVRAVGSKPSKLASDLSKGDVQLGGLLVPEVGTGTIRSS